MKKLLICILLIVSLSCCLLAFGCNGEETKHVYELDSDYETALQHFGVYQMTCSICGESISIKPTDLFAKANSDIGDESYDKLFVEYRSTLYSKGQELARRLKLYTDDSDFSDDRQGLTSFLKAYMPELVVDLINLCSDPKVCVDDKIHVLLSTSDNLKQDLSVILYNKFYKIKVTPSLMGDYSSNSKLVRITNNID